MIGKEQSLSILYRKVFRKSLFVFLFCLFLLGTLIPATGTKVYGAGKYKVGDVVKFAGYEWYIIGTESEGVKAPEGCYTLFAKNNDFGSTAFRAGGSRYNSAAALYKDSDLHKKMEEIAKGFSEQDRKDIIARDKLDEIKGDEVTNQLVWPIGTTINATSNKVGGEWKLLDQKIREFPDSYWSRTSYEAVGAADIFIGDAPPSGPVDVKSGSYTAHAFSPSGEIYGHYAGVLGSHASFVDSVFAARPAMYVKTDAVRDLNPNIVIILPPTSFSQQPQTQYALEGASVTFTAKARTNSGEITNAAYYKWEVKFPNDKNWYPLAQFMGMVALPRFGNTMTIRNVSGSLADNLFHIYGNPDKNSALVKDLEFRCVADGQISGIAYSDPVKFVIVSGKNQGGSDGREVELQNNGTHIQWRYKGEEESAWRDLVALSAITGADGNDGTNGKEIELQVQDGYIQWRYTTGADTTWKNLMPLSDLKGDAGEAGREVEFQNNGTHILWRYVGEQDSAWRDLVALSAITGADGNDGTNGKDGINGKEIELRVQDGYIQWRYTTGADTTWKNLMPLSDLKGDAGEAGREVEFQNNGTHILWRYVGEQDSAWRELVALSAITGADGNDGTNGKEIELQVQDGYIQWKYDDESDWRNLISLSALQGTKGDKGDKGDTPYIGENGNWWISGNDTNIPATGSHGSNGADGLNGKDGLIPYIGSNGNWWIGNLDTGIRASGTDGKDGVDGKDGLNALNGIDGKDGIDGRNGIDGKDGLNGKNGKDGKDGIGISDIKINDTGELIISLTDGTSKNLGNVKGEDGVSILGVSINEKGELIVSLSNGDKLNAGTVVKVIEKDAHLKIPVYISLGTAGCSLAGLIAMLFFQFAKRKKL